MNLFAGKLLTLAVYPLSISIWLMLVACVLAWHGGKRLCALITFTSTAMLWLCSMPVTAMSLMSELESGFAPVPMAGIPKMDAIVVLGGGVGAAVPPRLEPDLAGGADRVWFAARLFHAGKAPMVIAVGGAIPWLGPIAPEADSMQALLVAWGVPRNAIILGRKSRSTYENALECKRILQKEGLHKILLVTSAWHMRRALATFLSAGIAAIPAPTDYEAVRRNEASIMDFLPDAASLERTTRAFKEIMGFFAYRWRGWIES